MAYLTWEETVSDGAQVFYNIIFPYLSQDHVSVYFNGVAQPSSSYTFPNASQIQLVSPAVNGVTVKVARDTPKTLLTDFQTIVTESDLDSAYLHVLYRTQELQDKWDEAVAAALSVTPSTPLHNLSAIVKPSVTDDSNSGYSVGSLWFVSGIGGSDTDGLLYQASDVTVGAAVWEVINRRSVTNTSAPNANHDYEDGFTVGDTWWDSTAGVLYVCTDNTNGAATWGSLSPSSISYPLTHTGLVHFKKGADVATVSSVNLASATGNYIRFTGTTTVAALGTVAAGSKYTGEAVSGFTFTHSANLRCPNDEDLVLKAGDMFEMESDGSGAWTISNVEPHNKRALIQDDWIYLESFSDTNVASLDLTSLNTNYSQYKEYKLVIDGLTVDTNDSEVGIRVDHGAGFITTSYNGEARAVDSDFNVGRNDFWPSDDRVLFIGHPAAAWGVRSGAYPAGAPYGEIMIYRVNETGEYTFFKSGHVLWRGANGDNWMSTYSNHGAVHDTGSVNGIRILTSTGNMTLSGKLFGRL